MRKILYIVLLMLLSSCLRNDDSINFNIDKQDNLYLDSLKKSWNTCMHLGKFDSLIENTRPVFNQAVRDNDTNLILYSGIAMFQSYVFNENNDSARVYIDKLQQFNYDMDDYRLGTLLYNALGIFTLKVDLNYSMALNYYIKSYEFASKSNDIINQLVLLTNIADIFYVRNDPNGLEYARKAYEIIQKNDVDKYFKAVTYNSLAQSCILNGWYQEAENYIDKSYRLVLEEKLNILTSKTLMLKAEVSDKIGNTSLAEDCYRKSFECFRYAEPSEQALIYLKYGKFLYGRYHRIDDAVSYLKMGLELSYQHEILQYRSLLLKELSDIYIIEGYTDSAFVYFQKYSSHLDSVKNVENEHRFNQQRLLYQKLRYDDMVREEKLRTMEAEKSLIIIGAILLIIVLTLVFLLIVYRKKHKMYRALVRQHQNYKIQLQLLQSYNKGSVIIDEKGTATDGKTEKHEDTHDQQRIYSNLERLMTEEKIFRQNDLSLAKVAELLGTNRTYVTQIIKNYSGKTFYSFLDYYRINEATTIMSVDKDISFKQLANDIGYNSLSVFYKAFQREIGCTPGQYRSGMNSIEKEK